MFGMNNMLIPARFLFTMGNFLVLLMMLNTRGPNVKASVPTSYSQSQYDTADSSLKNAIIVSITCMCVDVIGLFSSFSMFSPFMNSLHVLSKFIATLVLSLFISEKLNYVVVWYVWGFITFPVTFLEICRIALIAWSNKMEY
eukprot:ANDGO_00668.mRNA.1 hypothetical protein AURANDRAFT_33372